MSLLTREDLVGSLFFPQPVRSPPPRDARDLFVDVEGARLHVRVHGEPWRPLVLFFHGNAETVADYDDVAARLTGRVQLAVTDYRGYGESTGRPTLQRLFDDAVAVFDAVRPLAPLAPVVMGRSLGSAPVWHLVQERSAHLAGVVIDSGFSDLDAFARRRGLAPAQMLADERRVLDPLPKAARCPVPVLVLHGEDDSLIPLEEAVRVAGACSAASRTLVALPGRGHNDVLLDPAWWHAVERFLDERTHPLLAATLKERPLTSPFRVVVDVAGRSSVHDTDTLDAARAYAADVRLEGDDPAHTLALVFDARGARRDG
ncbi:MAG: alpha/beta hydrolase [Myxococcaceae bacterium]|nr:alpha/beta hydrolase [Myxococcaceae bacterium]